MQQKPIVSTPPGERLPRDREALRALVKERRTRGDAKSLATALEALAVATPNAVEEAALLVELATVRLCQSRQLEESFLAVARAIYLDPENEGLLVPLRDAARAAGAEGSYREILAELLVDAPEKARPMLEREQK